MTHTKLASFENGVKSIKANRNRANKNKYMDYAITLFILLMILSTLEILNAHFHFLNNVSIKHISFGLFQPIFDLGYIGMFIIVAFFPLPDYILVTFYGYLASLGLFNVYLTLLVSVLSMMFLSLLEYFGGKLAGRALLLRVLSVFKIHEKDLKVAEDWIEDNGTFSVFISTFISYFSTVVWLASGILNMKFKKFAPSVFAGYLIRFSILVYIGYSSFSFFSFIIEGKFLRYFIVLDVVSAICLSVLFWKMYQDQKIK